MTRENETQPSADHVEVLPPLPLALESHQWRSTPRLFSADQMHDYARAAIAAMGAGGDAVAKLQAFKDYTHMRLDGMGVPVDPESPHKAAGCRIGGRMDYVEAALLAAPPAQEAVADELRALIDKYWDLAYREGAEGRTEDTEEGAAASTRYEIEKRLKLYAGTAPAASGGVSDLAAVVRSVIASIELYADDDEDAGKMHRMAHHWRKQMLAALNAAHDTGAQGGAKDSRRACTCEGRQVCGIKRGQRLGDNWRCVEGRENPPDTKATK